MTAALAACVPEGAFAQSLIPGIDAWAEAATQGSASKWGGSRVDFPLPTARPELPGRLDSQLWPLSVHTSEPAPWPRARRVLRAAEDAFALFHATGWAISFGDGGQGKTAGYDLYLVPTEANGSEARIDATEPVWGLDSARAFALLDPRVPERQLDACISQALAETLLYEFDPAEAPSLRKSTAAYLSYLASGELGCAPEQVEKLEASPELSPFSQKNHAHVEPGEASEGQREPHEARGAGWLVHFGRRQDLNTGTFLRDMWQFARQRTWEGEGLRASPDLFEAIAATLSADDQLLEDIASGLAEQRALTWLKGRSLSDMPHDPSPRQARSKGRNQAQPWTPLHFSKLPSRLLPSPPIEPLGSFYVLVHIDTPLEPGELVRVWSRGEYGTRWGLAISTLDKNQQVLTRMNAPVRKTPSAYLSVDVLPQARALLISVTNLADGTPDADEGAPFEVRSVAITVDRTGGGHSENNEAGDVHNL